MGYISLTGNPITFTTNRVNTISSLVLNGKTTQSGTGDPSPDNIRPIYGVGQYDLNIVFTGRENWGKDGINILWFTNAYPDASNSAICTDFKVLEDARRNGIYAMIQRDKCVGFAFGSNSGFNTSDEVKEFLTSRYNKGTPVRFICKSTSYPTATQVYCGLSITDANGYHGYVAGPMAPLFDGDSVDFITGKANRPLSTPTTETVPISKPITNAAGAVTLSAENTMNVTYFQLEASNNKYQDIQIQDNALLTQLQQSWKNGDYTTAFNIIDNNPQLDTKSFVADVINTLTANLTYLQTLNDPTFKADRIQTSSTPPVDLQVGKVYFKTL